MIYLIEMKTMIFFEYLSESGFSGLKDEQDKKTPSLRA